MGFPSYEKLLDLNKLHKRGGLSEKYWERLTKVFWRFKTFVHHYNSTTAWLGEALPSTNNQLDLYSSYLASTGELRDPKTIQAHLSAIRTVNRLYGYQPSPPDHHLKLTM